MQKDERSERNKKCWVCLQEVRNARTCKSRCFGHFSTRGVRQSAGVSVVTLDVLAVLPPVQCREACLGVHEWEKTLTQYFQGSPAGLINKMD